MPPSPKHNFDNSTIGPAGAYDLTEGKKAKWLPATQYNLDFAILLARIILIFCTFSLDITIHFAWPEPPKFAASERIFLP
jgi:hypothetical protein